MAETMPKTRVRESRLVSSRSERCSSAGAAGGETGEFSVASSLLSKAFAIIDKNVKRGILHKNTAALPLPLPRRGWQLGDHLREL